MTAKRALELCARTREFGPPLRLLWSSLTSIDFLRKRKVDSTIRACPRPTLPRMATPEAPPSADEHQRAELIRTSNGRPTQMIQQRNAKLVEAEGRKCQTTPGHDKIPQWTQEIWDAINKAVADEHQGTAVAAKFLTPPVPDGTMAGTVVADAVHADEDGVLSVDESENRTLVEIAVLFRVRGSQVESEAKMKTAESLAIRAANLLARGEDLIIFQGLAATQDPLFTSKSVSIDQSKKSKAGSQRRRFVHF